jgi:Zn-dependent protease with chaperone function/Zn-finger nucleic acid-binding protein
VTPKNLFQYRRSFNTRIALVFAGLAGVYFLLLLGLAMLLRGILAIVLLARRGAPPTLPDWMGAVPWILATLALAVLFVGIRYLRHRRRGPARLLQRLGATRPDPEDGYHRRYANIVQELAVAAGIPVPQAWVLPELYRNALSIDGHIAVTEGLISTLSRDELSAVVAHEFGHVVVGDIHLKTIVAGMISLFGMPGFLLVAIEAQARRKEGQSLMTDRWGRQVDGRHGENVLALGGLAVVYLAILAYSAVARFLVRMLSAIVSRQYEHLADHVAVELTRDPLALARALDIVGRDRVVHPRGALDPALAMCYIMNPAVNALDDGDSWWSNLFSTHPPVATRIGRMLHLAHAPATALAQRREPPPAQGTLYAQHEGSWIGPFSFNDLVEKTWVVPTTLIRNAAGVQVAAAALFRAVAARTKPTGIGCPRCGTGLSRVDYEQVRIRRCPSCSGVLLRDREFSKVLARREITFLPAEIAMASRLAGTVRVEPPAQGTDAPPAQQRPPTIDQADPSPRLTCPDCGGVMSREFFNLVYRIPIDRCRPCGLAFLDAGELEALQAAFEGVGHPATAARRAASTGPEGGGAPSKF